MKIKPISYLSSGFTLVETVVYMAIVSIISIVVVGFMIESGRMQGFIAEQSEAISIADKATNALAKALRETTDGDDGAYALSNLSDYQLTFYADIDADSATERITYSLSGTNLIQTIVEPSGVPAQYLSGNSKQKTVAAYIVNQTFSQNPIFQYYDLNNQQLAGTIDASDVMMIRIHLDVNYNPNRVPDTHAIETYVQLRNLNNNL